MPLILCKGKLTLVSLFDVKSGKPIAMFSTEMTLMSLEFSIFGQHIFLVETIKGVGTSSYFQSSVFKASEAAFHFSAIN
ncbi:unnamed protein product [Blepharisma stoltei]|uniref:Uncharacterized protein n=1 Tax=Blepharisma stoltei TaxID=1481888 RepID=A0AAU9IRR6_9CILI|nr:unnamed protein product [Blepharisma stoltei]